MDLYDFSPNPQMAWLNVNRQCNFRCRWCYNGAAGFKSEDSMTFELAADLIRVSKDVGVAHVNFVGGEPTLWPPLFDAVGLCHDLGLTTGLITNASRFGDDRFWNAYLEHPCDRLSISVKSMREQEFGEVTGSRAYSQTRIGIRRAVEHFDTGVTTVYNSLVGLDGLRAIAEGTRELGSRSIIVNMCSPTLCEDGVDAGFSVGVERIARDTIEMCAFLDEIYDGAYEVDVQMPLCLFPQDFIDEMIAQGRIQTICQVFSRGGINFDPSGDVIVCNELYDVVVARRGVDYTDAKSLISFLDSDEIRGHYRKILRYPSEECSLCRRQGDCRGGCLLNWLVMDPGICHAVR